ncbi:MAG TPA: tetrathionate reductase family octaheme c-type cytochrome, partial [Phycisphaeraceae bacterium]|nr:tetrathionate reductase family octaheme c-type cytochrome [Phycisphaeraceae bacterium]
MSVRNTVIGFMMFVSVVAIVAIGYGSYRILVPATLENVRHDDPWKNTPPEPQHTDHSDLIQGVFTDGPSVTRECLRCHGNAAREVMKTVHWKWKGDPVHIPGKPNLPPVEIGKKNLINNFCIGIEPNLGGCTICHAGYGWFDDNFNFKDESLVDCLVCHDNTGTYGKSDGGLPTPGVDLTAVAKGVGPSKRANCGWCHFNGGGGDAVKHGDLDQTLINPAQRIDMHMGKQGFECITCHRTEHHLIKGRAMSVSVDHKNSISCTDCHNEKPHASERLNAHTFSVACQTCHIPEFAVGEPTKVDWDWSQAGQDLPITDHHVYMKIKGRFIYKKDVVPTYRWHNGMAKRYLAGDKIDPNGITKINEPLGSIHDPNSKITPFKVHRAKQPYD